MYYAVFRETSYAPDQPVYETDEFQQFHKEHTRQRGYLGTVVVDAGEGRVLTVTLWTSAQEMETGRKAMGPVVNRYLNPLMIEPAKLLGTGAVVLSDLVGLPFVRCR